MAANIWFLTLCITGQFIRIDTHTLYKWIVDSKTRFNYDPDIRNPLGVYNWRHTYPESCDGAVQSPVDIQTDRVKYNRDFPCPRMLYTHSLLRGELKNNGHSATFEPENEMGFRLTDIPNRRGIYNLNDFHLHYGGIEGRVFEIQGQRFRGSGVMSAGSEHTIDGLRFEGEIHFVFWNSKYKDLEEADNKTDGVVVASFLVQKIPFDMANSGVTSKFSNFLEKYIPRVAAYQQNTTLELDLSMFFDRQCEFYTYFGSTTTPTCHESVQWVIFREPIRVTERAWYQLTKLESRGDFNRQFGNYRNSQPLNARLVEANFRREIGPVLPSPNSDVVRPMSERLKLTGMRAPAQVVRPVGPPKLDRPNMAGIPSSRGNMADIPMRRGNMADIPMRRQNMADIPMRRQNMADIPTSRGNMADIPMRRGNMADIPMRRQNMADIPMRRDNVADIPMRGQNMADIPMMRQNMADIPMTRQNMADIPMRRHNMDVSTRRQSMSYGPMRSGSIVDTTMMRRTQVDPSGMRGNMAEGPLSRGNMADIPMRREFPMSRRRMQDSAMRQINMADAPIMRENIDFPPMVQDNRITMMRHPEFPPLGMQIRRIDEMTRRLPHHKYMPGQTIGQSIGFRPPPLPEQPMALQALPMPGPHAPFSPPRMPMPEQFLMRLHPSELWKQLCAMLGIPY